MSSFTSEFLTFIGLGMTLALSLVTATWLLLNKIVDVANKLYQKIDETQRLLIEKIEYHEKHDDARFNGINNDLWAIRVRNAARDGDLSFISEKKSPNCED